GTARRGARSTASNAWRTACLAITETLLHHDCDEDRPQPDHDVVAVVKQRDVLRPEIRGERVETLDIRLPRPVGQKTERVRHFKGVINFPLGDVWLPQDDKRSAGLADEEGFHCGEGDGLIESDHAPLTISGGK